MGSTVRDRRSRHPGNIISTERSFVGDLVGTYNVLVELMNLVGQGTVTLHTTTYPLDAAVDALQDLHGDKIRGRAILVPGGA